MKYLKKYTDKLNKPIDNKVDEGLSLLVPFATIAIFHVVVNMLEKRSMLKKLNKKDFSEIERMVSEFKDKKQLIGEVIDNEAYSQVVYEFKDDNIIAMKLFKKDKKFQFRWNFEMPIFPFVKYSQKDDIEITLNGEEMRQMQSLINKIKSEKFDDSDIDKHVIK
jgi:hypothetical protein